MARQGILDPRSAARLLIAAAILDLLCVYLLGRMLFPALRTTVLPLLPHGLRPFALATMIVALVPVLWFVSDVVAFGHSPGRLAVGIHMSHAAGGPLPLAKRLTRFTAKLLGLGLTGLRLNTLAPYDLRVQTAWRSPLAALAAGDLRLAFLSGTLQGKSIALARVPGYDPRVPLRIGRDSSWAQITLPDDSVSKRHCEVMVQNGVPMIRDLGSTGGTTIDGRRIAPQTWHALAGAREFAAAGQRMALRS